MFWQCRHIEGGVPDSWHNDTPTVAEQAFKQIMGAIDMPDDRGPDYDQWLFTEAYEAGAASLREQLAQAQSRIAELEGSEPPDEMERRMR